jgi:hypothetical protein
MEYIDYGAEFEKTLAPGKLEKMSNDEYKIKYIFWLEQELYDARLIKATHSAEG